MHRPPRRCYGLFGSNSSSPAPSSAAAPSNPFAANPLTTGSSGRGGDVVDDLNRGSTLQKSGAPDEHSKQRGVRPDPGQPRLIATAGITGLYPAALTRGADLSSGGSGARPGPSVVEVGRRGQHDGQNRSTARKRTNH